MGTADLALLIVGGGLWLLWSLGIAYMLALTLSAVVLRSRKYASASSDRRFCILVPAHNEELLLGGVITKLFELDYPRELWQVVVIADNCSDRTAEIARQAGAEVLERTNLDLRGKGYALEWALVQLLPDERRFDAFVVMDADSELSANFLRVMNSALASGHRVVQGRYDVLNLHEGWRTRLMACALALAHYVKPKGRNALGLSDGLKGNGMCFARSVLEQVPWSGESITEDIEYTLRLVQAGIRIEFSPDAQVLAQMPTSSKQATSQRERWEGGRYALLKRAFGLLARGVLGRKPLVMDRAIELIIPPFVELFAVPVVFLVASGIISAVFPASPVARGMMTLWAITLAAEVLYLLAGLAIARVPIRVASALLFAPFYIVWKFGVYGALILKRGAGGWKRTERHEIAPK